MKENTALKLAAVIITICVILTILSIISAPSRLEPVKVPPAPEVELIVPGPSEAIDDILDSNP